jgi:hypothetical protein
LEQEGKATGRLIPVAFSALVDTMDTLEFMVSMVSMVSKTDPKQAKNPKNGGLAGIRAMPLSVEQACFMV